MNNRKSTFVKLVLISVIIFLGSTVQAEKIYRWQDDSGVWQFSKRPPIGKQAEQIKIYAPTSSSAPTENEEASTSDSEPEATLQQDARSAKVRAEDQAMQKKNCANVQKNLKNLLNTGHFRYKNDKTGEVAYLTDEEKQNWIRKSKEEIKKYCH